MKALTQHTSRGIILTLSALLALTAGADEVPPWWPARVQVFNPACTDGTAACVNDPRNSANRLEQAYYEPLMPAAVTGKHHLCVSFPHLNEDSYWLAAAYGIIEEGRRLGQKITLVEAGGYGNLSKQLAQIDTCTTGGAEAVLLGAISSDGNAPQVDALRAQGVKVVDLINGTNTAVDAKSVESYFSMGYMACSWVAERHPAGTPTVRIGWYPGPHGAGWSMGGNKGCRAAVEGSAAEIVDTRWGDTRIEAQCELVEAGLNAYPDLAYILGTSPTAESAIAVLRDRGMTDRVKIVVYYYTQSVHELIAQGQVAMAPTDQVILQARIAVDQAVRLLEGKPMATGGRPQLTDLGRMAEHVQPLPVAVTPQTLQAFDTTTTLAPAGWKPIFSIE